MELRLQRWIVTLARQAIHAAAEGTEPSHPEEVPEELREHRATFVTIRKRGALRGCIGHLEAVQPLYKDVMQNARDAAIHDPRFPAVTPNEVHHLEVEISILSKPVELQYTSTEELPAKLNKELGVIIRFGGHSATFLPQVWGELPEPGEFLSELCRKAGLPDDRWREEPKLAILTYTIEKCYL